MRIETLLVIYDLLKREVDSLTLDLQRARDVRSDVDCEEPAYPLLDQACKDAYALLRPVQNALDEFKALEWSSRAGE